MTLVGKVMGSVLKSTGFRRFAQNTAKANEKTFTKMFTNSAKVNAEYSKDAIKLSDLETVAKGTSKPKPDKVEVSIMKSFKERLSHAIDFLKYRNPADFVAKSEVQQHLGELIEKKAKIVNVGLFKNNTVLTDTMKKIDVSQLDTEIKNCRKLLDEIEII
jgi:hypothetical protein